MTEPNTDVTDPKGDEGSEDEPPPCNHNWMLPGRPGGLSMICPRCGALLVM